MSLVVLTLALAAGAAVPTPAPVPDDVRRLAASGLVAQARSDFDAFGHHYPDLRLGRIAAVHSWATQVLTGDPTQVPIVGGDRIWVAALANGETPVGTGLLARDDAGTVSIVGTDERADLAASLTAHPDEVLVQTPREESYLVSADGRVRAADQAARATLPSPQGLAAAEKAVARDAAPSVSVSAPPGDTLVGAAGSTARGATSSALSVPWSSLGWGGLVAGVVGVALVARRRRRREA